MPILLGALTSSDRVSLCCPVFDGINFRPKIPAACLIVEPEHLYSECRFQGGFSAESKHGGKKKVKRESRREELRIVVVVK